MSLRNKKQPWLLIAFGVLSAAVYLAFNDGSENSPPSKPQLQAAEMRRMQRFSRGTDRYLKFTRSGELVRPTGYRKWVYVGTPLTPNDMNRGKAPFPEFHSVYIDPMSFAAYEKTGKFPDGTVLVKELVSVGGKEATSGKGYFMGNFIGLEVSIKDKIRFRKAPGHWAYFSFGHKYPLKKMAKANRVMNCNSCHEGNAGQDFVFTQYYPMLRAAKKAADLKSADRSGGKNCSK